MYPVCHSTGHGASIGFGAPPHDPSAWHQLKPIEIAGDSVTIAPSRLISVLPIEPDVEQLCDTGMTTVAK